MAKQQIVMQRRWNHVSEGVAAPSSSSPGASAPLLASADANPGCSLCMEPEESELRGPMCVPSSQMAQSLTKEVMYSGCCSITVFSFNFS